MVKSDILKFRRGAGVGFILFEDVIKEPGKHLFFSVLKFLLLLLHKVYRFLIQRISPAGLLFAASVSSLML